MLTVTIPVTWPGQVSTGEQRLEAQVDYTVQSAEASQQGEAWHPGQELNSGAPRTWKGLTALNTEPKVIVPGMVTTHVS